MEKYPPVLSPMEAKRGFVWMAFQYLLLPQLLAYLNIPGALLNFSYHALCFLAVSLIFWKYLRDCLGWSAKNWKKLSFLCVIALSVYYVTAYLFRLLVTGLEPAFSNRNDEALLEMAGSSLVLFALTTLLLAPVTEELLFRGLLFGRLSKRNRVLGYLASSLCFCLIHLMGYLGTYTPMQFFLALLQYLPAGLILAWSQEKSQSVTAPILIHMVINGISLVSIL